MTEQDLAGHRALVTGGASGIGLACAREFASRGAHVIVADFNGEAAAAVQADALHDDGFADRIQAMSQHHVLVTAAGRAGHEHQASLHGRQSRERAGCAVDVRGEIPACAGMTRCAGITACARMTGCAAPTGSRSQCERRRQI